MNSTSICFNLHEVTQRNPDYLGDESRCTHVCPVGWMKYKQA
jgi:hypothetical protein